MRLISVALSHLRLPIRPLANLHLRARFLIRSGRLRSRLLIINVVAVRALIDHVVVVAIALLVVILVIVIHKALGSLDLFLLLVVDVRHVFVILVEEVVLVFYSLHLQLFLAHLLLILQYQIIAIADINDRLSFALAARGVSHCRSKLLNI